jgi:hypothetical protein
MKDFAFIVYVDEVDRTFYGRVQARDASTARIRLQGWANSKGWGSQEFNLLPLTPNSDFQCAVFE